MIYIYIIDLLLAKCDLNEKMLHEIGRSFQRMNKVSTSGKRIEHNF